MLKFARRIANPAPPHERFSGSAALAMMPAFAMFYILIILPFLPDDGSGRIENILFWPVIAAISLALIFYNRSRIDRGFFLSLPVLSLVAYLLFAAASVSWAHSPDYAFSRLIAQVMLVIVIVLPYALPIPVTHSIRNIHVCYAIALAINAVYVLTIPPTPIGHTGYFTHKQELGMLCATGLILSCHEILFRGWRRLLGIFALCLGVWMLIASQSKSAAAFSVFAIFFSMLVWLACEALRTTPAFILGGATIVSLFFTDPVSRIAYRLYGDPTLTGRTEIWNFINYQISFKPWFGWGFHSYWFVPNSPHNAASGYIRDMPSSHSGYLELKLETGRIGYAIFLVFIYASLHWLAIVRRKDPGRAWLYLTISIFAIMLNFVDSSWLVVNQLWMLYLIVVAETVRYSRVSGLNTAQAKGKAQVRSKSRPGQIVAPRI